MKTKYFNKIPPAKSLKKIAEKNKPPDPPESYRLDIFVFELIEQLKIKSMQGDTSYISSRLSNYEMYYFRTYWQPKFEEKGYFVNTKYDSTLEAAAIFVSWS